MNVPYPTSHPLCKEQQQQKKLDLSSICRNKMFRAWELLAAFPFLTPF